MFGIPQPPVCGRCGVRHTNAHECPTLFLPDAATYPASGDGAENVSVVRYVALQSLAEVVTAAIRHDASMARLERELGEVR